MHILAAIAGMPCSFRANRSLVQRVNSVRKRVAEAILLLHDRYSKEGKEDIQILREDLAHIVGTAKESVIRMLTEFKDDGFIEITDGIIRINNRKKLEALPT